MGPTGRTIGWESRVRAASGRYRAKEAGKKHSQMLPGLEDNRLHLLAYAGQIADFLLIRSRHPHLHPLPGAVKTRQAHRVATIRLDLIAR